MNQNKYAPVIRFLLFQCIILGTNNVFTLGDVATQPWSSSSDGNRSHPMDRSGFLDQNNSMGGIVWENLGCVTQEGDSILTPFSGFLANGHVCGILGPSGSGKSTFLSALAGRTEASLSVGGHVLHYSSESTTTSPKALVGAPVLPDRVAWLRQQDAFFERLTVQETLELAVYFEWPWLTKKEREAMTRACLQSLGLTQVKTRQVGSPKNARTSKGASLSGGEVRRLSVALELVTQPHLFLADEPTSGIDGKLAESVMAAIASNAKEHQFPCFCILHQPRSSIYHMLDALILMSPGGRVIYMGTCDDSIPYFAALGYSCPEETNPADFFIDLVYIDTDDPKKAKEDRDRIDQLANAFQKHNRKVSTSLGDLRLSIAVGSIPNRNSVAQPSIGRVIRRFGALLRRSWRQTYRSISLNVGRLAISCGTALLLSQIFPSVVKGPPTNTSVTDRICVLTFGAITNFLVSVVKTIGIFSKEKPVVQRERHRKDHTNMEYIFAKALSEFPLDAAFATVFTITLKLVTGLAIGWKQLSLVFSLMTISGASLGFLLGGITKSEDEAIVLAMPVVILFMVVGVINPSGVDPNESSPLLLQALKFFSPIAAAIEASMVAEFSGMKFATSSMLNMQRFRDLPRMGGLALVRSGDETLYALGLGAVSFDAVMSHMTTLVFVNFALSWLGLALADTQAMQRWKHSIRRSLSPQKTRPEADDKRSPGPQLACKEKRRRAAWGLPLPKFH